MATPYIFEGLFNKCSTMCLNNKLMTGNELNSNNDNNNNGSVIFVEA
jgi:hypothetical protein